MRTVPGISSYDYNRLINAVYKGANGKVPGVVLAGSRGAAIQTVDATSSSDIAFQYTANAEL